MAGRVYRRPRELAIRRSNPFHLWGETGQKVGLPVGKTPEELILSAVDLVYRPRARGMPPFYCLTDRLSFFSTLATLLWRRPEWPLR